MKKREGITLIALVVTIILLIILAAVTINLIIGENGILNKVKYAKEETIKSSALEKIQLAILESYNQDGKIIYGDMQNINGLESNINKINGLQSKITESIESFPIYIIVNGYEFEINLNGQIVLKGERVLKENDEALARQSLVMLEDFEYNYGVVKNITNINTTEKKFGNASLYLNKTTISNSNQTKFNFSSDFTIDYWLKLSEENLSKEWAGNVVVGKTGGIWIGFNSGKFIVRSFEKTNHIEIDPPTTDEWVHIAICRSNGILYVFFNGELKGQVANTTNFVQGTLYIGSTGTANYTMNSYIDELRIVNGVAKWTTNFSVPTEEYQDIDAVLYHFDDIDVLSNTAKINDVEKKFGNRSIYVNDTRIAYKEKEEYNFDSDFTIDYWIKLSEENLTKEWTGNIVVEKDAGIWIGFNYDKFIVRSFEQKTHLKIDAPPTNEWVHIAVCRRGETLYVFYNGEMKIQISNTSNFVKGNLYIGATGEDNYTKDSYIDEIRILKGYCAWTNNFEVPEKEYAY